MDGYFLIHRQIFESWVFADEKALKIWIWLIGKARHKPGFVPLKIGKGAITVKLDRGQLIFGRNKAAETLFLNGSLIYRKLQKFEEDGMIKIEANNQYSVITICNYESYQAPGGIERTSSEQQANKQRTSSEQQANTNNKDNKDKNDKNDKKGKEKPAKKSNSIESLKSEYPEQFAILKELKPFFPVSVLKSLTNNDIRNWLDALDKLNKIDGYDNETIKKVIKFGRQDDFWQQNVFSISALRKKTDGVQKFAKIKAAADKGKRNGHKKETAESQIEKNKRIDESLYKHFKI